MESEILRAKADRFLTSRYRSEIDALEAAKSDKIPLYLGYPPRKMVARVAEMMKDACQKRLTDEMTSGNHLLQYGYRMGDPKFRDHLAKFLSHQYGYEVRRDRLLATSGATSSLFHICTLFFNPGDLVFVEEPSYFIALEMMEKDLNRRIIHVSLDEDGIIPESLESTIKQFYPKEGFVPSTDRPYWSMLYACPCFQNPTGTCLSEERCKAVVAIARRYHLLVVSEDLYAPLHWSFGADGKVQSYSPKQLKYFDREDDEDFFGNVISNNSFSKIMAPGFRLGWMEAPPVILGKFACSGYLYSSGDFNHFMSGLIGTALESGQLNSHVEDMCTQYKEKIEAMHEVFEEKLKGIIKYKLPEGGFFVWIKLPGTMHCDELAALCLKKYRVAFSPGTKFTKTEGNLSNFIRIAFSYLEKDVFIEGVKELTAAILELYEINQSIGN